MYKHIRRDNVRSAERVRDVLKSEVETRLEFPSIGRVGRVLGTRELPTTPFPYIIVYQVESETVLILTIRHGARLYPPDGRSQAG